LGFFFKANIVTSMKSLGHSPVTYMLYFTSHYIKLPTPVATLSKAWACSHSPAGIAVSNPAESMNVPLLCLLCVL
jgi:hypothetical protein